MTLLLFGGFGPFETDVDRDFELVLVTGRCSFRCVCASSERILALAILVGRLRSFRDGCWLESLH